MILVDTSVWVDHLREKDDQLASLLLANQVMVHPFIIGEIAVGNLKNRQRVLTTLEGLPTAPIASHEEIMRMIQSHSLFGLGIGYIDIHLLASAKLAAGTHLWTRDQRLDAASTRLHLSSAMH